MACATWEVHKNFTISMKKRKKDHLLLSIFTEVKGRSGLNFYIKYIHRSYSRTIKTKHLLIMKALE